MRGGHWGGTTSGSTCCVPVVVKQGGSGVWLVLSSRRCAACSMTVVPGLGASAATCSLEGHPEPGVGQQEVWCMGCGHGQWMPWVGWVHPHDCCCGETINVCNRGGADKLGGGGPQSPVWPIGAAGAEHASLGAECCSSLFAYASWGKGGDSCTCGHEVGWEQWAGNSRWLWCQERCISCIVHYCGRHMGWCTRVAVLAKWN
jgi:hypothetical protein